MHELTKQGLAGLAGVLALMLTGPVMASAQDIDVQDIETPAQDAAAENASAEMDGGIESGIAFVPLSDRAAGKVSLRPVSETQVSGPQGSKTQSSATPASWIRVQSDNFVLRGPVNPKAAQSFLQDLEIFRAGFLQIIRTPALPANSQIYNQVMPITVINDDGHAARMLGSEHAAGFYQNDLSGPVLILNASAGLETGRQARLLAFRSVAGHLLSQSPAGVYPPWLREGLIDYAGVSEILDNNMKIGGYNSRHDYLLRDGRWIRTRDMIKPFHDSPLAAAFQSGSDIDWHGQFSAQSWLAVHYMMSNRNLAAALPGYLDRINSGQDPAQAFKAAFGLSDKRFEKGMRSHLKNSQFKARMLTLSDVSMAAEPKVMTRPEQDLYFGLALISAVFDGDSLAYAENYMAKIPGSGALAGEVLAARARLAEQQGDTAAADVHLSAALKAAPDNTYVHRAAGDIAFGRFGESRSAEHLERLRGHAESILAALPGDRQASYFYAAACAGLACPANAAASAAMHGSSPALDYAGANLNLIPALLSGGAYEKALSVAQIAAVWGDSPEAREGGMMAAKDILAAMKTR